MTIEQLKAAAYDAMATIEHWQRQLAQINQQIAVEIQATQTPAETEKKPLASAANNK